MLTDFLRNEYRSIKEFALSSYAQTKEEIGGNVIAEPCHGHDCSERLSDAFIGYIPVSDRTTDKNCIGILCDYHRLVQGNHTKLKNLSAMNELIHQHRLLYNYSIPLESDLVLHLRLGDVARKSKGCIFDLNRCMHMHNRLYMYPISCYSFVNPKLPPPPMRMVIVSSNNHGHSDYTYVYRGAVVDYFIANGYDVAERSTGTTDEDITFMAYAKYFVSGGGGFSALGLNLARINGASTFDIPKICQRKNMKFNMTMLHTN
jgi:hypothetical protein